MQVVPFCWLYEWWVGLLRGRCGVGGLQGGVEKERRGVQCSAEGCRVGNSGDWGAEMDH